MRKSALLVVVSMIGTTLSWVVPSAALSSAAAMIAPPPVATPTAVLVENITPVGLGVLVSWQPSPPEQAVTAYRITTAASPDDVDATAACQGPFTTTTDAQSSLARVGGLCEGVAYTAQIIATNAVGDSAPSGTSAPVAVLPPQPPAAPVVADALGRNGQVVAGWVSALDDGGSAITGYRLTARVHGADPTAAPAATVNVAASARTASLTGLTNGTEYDVAVVAINAIGDSPAGSASATPSIAYAPAAPVDLSAVPDGAGKVVLTWAPPADDGGAQLTSYVVTAQQVTAGEVGTFTPTTGTTPTTTTVSSTSTGLTLTSLTPSNGLFDISVAAVNAAGTGAAVHTPAPVTPKTEVAPQARPLTAATMNALASDQAGVLTWPAPVPAEVAALQVGNVIVAPPAEAAPQGLIRKVESIATAPDGAKSLTTTVAAIGDVFSSLSLSQSSNPLLGQAASPTASSSTITPMAVRRLPAPTTSKTTPKAKSKTKPKTKPKAPVRKPANTLTRRPVRGKFIPTSPGVALLRQPTQPAGELSASLNASLTLSKKIDFGDDNGAFATVDVNVVPSIGVDLSVHQNAVGIPNGLGMTVHSTVKVALSAEVGLQGKWTRELGVIRGSSIVFTVGPLPVVIVPKMPVDLELSGSVSIKTELSMQVGMQLSYDTRDDQLKMKNLSKGPHFEGGVLGFATVTGEAKLALKPRPGLAFYDVFGPALLPSLELKAEVNPLPDPGEDYFCLTFQLNLAGGMTLDILGKHAELKISLAVIPFGKFELKTPPVGLLLAPDASKVEAGQSKQFTATRSDAQAPTGVTWKVNGGVTGDHISSAGLLTPAMPGGRVITVLATDATGATGKAPVAVGDGFNAPESVRATQTYPTTSVSVSWAQPAQSAGSPITSYRVTGGPAGPVTVGASSRQLTFENLRPTYYTFTVYAINSTGRVSPPGSVGMLVRPICTHRASTGAWNDPETWSTHTVPGPQAWVCVDSGNVVLPSSPITVQGLQLSGGTLTAPSTVTVTSSAVLAGTLTGAGQVVVQPGVDLEAAGLTVQGTRLVNQGTMRLHDSSVALYGGAVLDNEGTVLVDPGTSVGWDGSAGSSIVNGPSGTLQYLGQHSSSAWVSVPVDNAGTITSDLGVLDLQHLTLSGDAHFDGLGSTQAHDLAVSGPASFTGKLVQAGEIHGDGTLTVPSGSTLTMTSASVRTARVVNSGTLRVTTSSVYLSDGGVLDNRASMALEGDSYVSSDASGARVVNSGTIRALGYSGTTTLASPVTNSGTLLSNGGLLNVSSLTLGGSSTYTGSVRAQYIVTSGGSSTVNGTLTAAGTVSGSSDLVVPFGSTLRLTSTSVDGTRIVNRGTLSLSGGYAAYLVNGGRLDNHEQLDLQAASSIVSDGSPGNGVINNADGAIGYVGDGFSSGSISAPLLDSGATSTDSGPLSLSDVSLSGTPSFSGQVSASNLHLPGTAVSFTGLLTTVGSVNGPATLTIPDGAELVMTTTTLEGTQLVNRGTLRLRGSYASYLTQSAQVDNIATTLLESNGYVWWDNNGATSFVNEVTGRVRYLGVPGTTGTMGMPIRNAGTMTADSGVLSLSALSLDGATSTFNGPGTVAVSSLTPLGTGASFGGRLSVSGVVSGAPLTVPTGSQLTLSGSSLQQGARINNAGTTRLRGSYAPYFSAGSVIDNTGALIVESGAYAGWAGGTDTSFILNEAAGTLRFVGGPGSTGQILVPVTSRGTVQVDNGVLRLQNATVPSGQVVGPGTLELTNSTVYAPVTFSGSPTVSFSEVTVSGALSLAGVPDARVMNSLYGSGASPSVTIPVGSRIGLSSSSLNGIRLVNRGTARLSSSYAPYFTNGSVLDNFGTVLLDASSQVGWSGGSDASAILNEPGALLRYTGGEGLIGYIYVPVTNRGDIQVDAGTLQLVGASLLSGKVVGPGTLALSSSTVSAPVTFTGTPVLSLSEVTVLGSVNLAGVTNASFGGLYGGASGATLTVPSGTQVAMSYSTLSGLRIVNNGTMRLNQSWAPYFSNRSVLDNFGTLLLDSNVQVGWAGGTDTSALINEAGALLRYAGNPSSNGYVNVPLTNRGSIRVDDGTLQLNGAALPSGQVTGPGTLRLTNSSLSAPVTYVGSPGLSLAEVTLSGLVQLDGVPNVSLSGGTYGAPGGATLTVPLGSSASMSSATLWGVRFVNRGTTRLNQYYAPYFGGNAVFDNFGTALLDSDAQIGWAGGTDTSSFINEAGAVLRYTGGPGSSGGIGVPIDNRGSLYVDGGALSLSSLASADTASTVISVSGPADEDAGSIRVPAGTMLRGALQLVPVAGYQPESGSTWHVLRATDLIGSFSSISGSRRSWTGTIDPAGYAVSVTGGAPSVPGNVTSSAGIGSVAVTWTAPEANNHPITGYQVTTSPDGKTVNVPADKTSVTVPGLLNGTSYTLSVKAVNDVGAGDAAAAPARTPNGCATTRFSDVTSGNAFCPQIAWMAARGITNGTTMPDGSIEFRPTAGVTRAAMAPFLYRTLNSPAFTAPASPSFADVATTHPFYREIEWMRASGISTGTAQATGLPLYKPNDLVIRQAMAAFLYRAAGSPAFTAPASPSFADVPTSNPFYKQIEWMRATGISTGTAQPTGLPLFKPADAVARQGMAAFLYRFVNRP
jgi:hypothetical protein